MRSREGQDRMGGKRRTGSRELGRAGSWKIGQPGAKKPAGRAQNKGCSALGRHRGVAIELQMVSH
eukprot:4156129-Heterocapsa_arctica.AAC.1